MNTTKSILLFFSIFTFTLLACEKDEDPNEYSIEIRHPDNSPKHVGDTVHFHIHFEHLDGGVIHNVSWELADKSGTPVYLEEEIHADEVGTYELHMDIVMNVPEHSDLIFTAYVWDHEGSEKEQESLEFHVHP